MTLPQMFYRIKIWRFGNEQKWYLTFVICGGVLSSTYVSSSPNIMVFLFECWARHIQYGHVYLTFLYSSHHSRFKILQNNFKPMSKYYYLINKSSKTTKAYNVVIDPKYFLQFWYPLEPIWQDSRSGKIHLFLQNICLILCNMIMNSM